MTRKQWNAGMAVVLTMLLIVVLTLRSDAAMRETELASITDPMPSHASKCATVHRLRVLESGANALEIHVEAIGGVLVMNGGADSNGRLILTNCRIPADLAGRTVIDHPLLEAIELVESGWGHEAEARIVLTMPDGVRIATEEAEGVTVVNLQRDNQAYEIRLVATPYPPLSSAPSSDSHKLKAQLEDLAAIQSETNTTAWWPQARHGNMKNMLREVRDAEVSVSSYDVEMVAAQEDGAGVEGLAPEEPAVDEAAPVETAPTPPAGRRVPPPVTSDPGAQKELANALRDTAEEERIEETKPVKVYHGDPLRRPITLDLRNAEMYNVVQYLAVRGGLNVVANHDLGEPIDLYLKDVPLLQAMETALRLNELGLVEEEGIYHIRSYEEAVFADRMTDVADIENADVEEIAATLQQVLSGSEYEQYISISSNKNANTIIISGPENEVPPLIRMAKRLDVEQSVLPTVTMPIKLNYAEPVDMIAIITPILTEKIGQVQVDERARILVVTDIPIIVEKVTDLVNQLDLPMKSIAIEGLIVDVTLTDAADTGVDWSISAVQSQSRRDAAGNTGIFTGNLQELSLNSDLSVGDAAGLLNFGILSGDIDWRGVIQAEVRNNNSTLLSNPKLVTVENQEAKITIASEIPYVELTQSEQGGQQTSTQFKPIGTELTVKPKVTHDNHIIAEITAKESTSSQVVNGIPVEDKREIHTYPHIASGQTIYLGGLRKNNDTVSIRKVPILGDVPVVNFLFRSNQRNETINELLVFLTCTVLDEEGSLTEYQQERVEQVRDVTVDVSAETALIYDAVNPSEMRDPAWKWRKHGTK